MYGYEIEKESESLKRMEMQVIPFPLGAGVVGTQPHIHNAIEILYVTEGDFTMVCDGREVHAKAGDAVLFRSNCIHRTKSGDREKNFYWVLKISTELIIKILPKSSRTDSLLRLSVSNGDDKFHWCADELRGGDIAEGFEKLAEAYERNDSHSELAMRIAAATVVLGILRDIGGDAIPENLALSELIYKAVVYVNDNYADDISTEGISKQVGLSYSYFSRSFKKIIGISFRSYLNSVRVNHAEQLIMTSEKSVTEISELCGFENPSYFISVYRSLKGKTPFRNRRENGIF